MKIVLILMVRNESKIIQRCLKAVEGLVDAFCVHDTGSTDNTCELVEEFLQTHKGCLTKSEWRDFGYNRTESFREARKFLQDQDLSQTYGLLLDGDMVFQVGTLLQHPLTEKGYTIIQKNGTLEYPNCRLVRMDYDWVCKGVTHEYWDGPTSSLPQTVCYIDDKNDGGCKSDKFERDARLLEKGLADEPENVRYMFYLAQTYHCLGRLDDAVRMYKKRVKAGGWIEEHWYSLYVIGQIHLARGNVPKFEEYMLKAQELRPTRSEPLYKLTKYFREKAQHFKAYQYALMGKKVPLSSDSLFIETDVYTKLFDYEMTILSYYVSPDKNEGLRKTWEYLLRTNDGNVFSNMIFYITPLGKGKSLGIDRTFFGPDYHPGSVCLFANGMNIRYVNYRLDLETRNTYEMSENGVYSTAHTVRTKNAYFDGKALVAMNDDTVGLEKRPTHIRGLEDVRVFGRGDELWCTATCLEYSEKIRILYGKYNRDGTYQECRILDSPTEQPCEKNWLGIPHTKDIIYNWLPLQIGTVETTQLRIHTTHQTPPFFERVRGSASPIRFGDELWVLTHAVEYSVPRKYYHMFVALDAFSYKPLRMTLPFVFEEASVEYCLGIRLNENGIECVYSSMDDNPCITTIPLTRLQWMSL